MSRLIVRTAATLAAAVVIAAPLAAQAAPERQDARLERELQALVTGFQGDVGIYARHLKSGRTAAIRADEVFPTASMIKVPILVTLYDQVVKGQLDLHAPQIRADTALYAYPEDVGEIGNLKPGTKVTTSMLAFMMISTSDNTAALWLQSLVGGGTAVNAWLAANGFDSTRVNSRTPGREQARSRYGWGQTTPREMTRLFTRIREGGVVSPAASEEMYRTLARSYWNAGGLSALPPWVHAASKQGEVDHSRSETLLVNAPSGDYVFSVITKNQVDSSYVFDNAGFVLRRKVSALLWRYFEPKHPYTPAPGAERLKPE